MNSMDKVEGKDVGASYIIEEGKTMVQKGDTSLYGNTNRSRRI